MRLFLLSLCTLIFLHASLIDELQSKTKRSQSDLDKKREGSYITGLPLANFDPDKGTGYGVRLYWYDNGKKSDPLFAYTAYRHQIFAQYFQTTNGWQYHWIHWDAPYFKNSKFRLTASLLFEKNTQAHYFGVNSQTLNALTAPDGKSFNTTKAYQEYLNTLGSPYYDRYLYEKPSLELTAHYDLLGGVMRFAFGINIGRSSISAYNNQLVPLNGESTPNAQNRLYNDRNTLIGFDGGRENGIKIGLIYDSRDLRQNPKKGSAHDFVAEFFTPLLGSDFEYQNYTFSTKNFYTPSSYDKLTLGFHALYNVHSGNTPFYAMNNFSYSDDLKHGLGGLRSLRGFQQDRFVAPVKTFINLEARWFATSLSGKGQLFDFYLVPFIDLGNVYDDVKSTDFFNKNWKQTQGAGLHVVWNQTTVIIVDYGVSSEESSLYINFNHLF